MGHRARKPSATVRFGCCANIPQGRPLVVARGGRRVVHCPLSLSERGRGAKRTQGYARGGRAAGFPPLRETIAKPPSFRHLPLRHSGIFHVIPAKAGIQRGRGSVAQFAGDARSASKPPSIPPWASRGKFCKGSGFRQNDVSFAAVSDLPNHRQNDARGHCFRVENGLVGNSQLGVRPVVLACVVIAIKVRKVRTRYV